MVISMDFDSCAPSLCPGWQCVKSMPTASIRFDTHDSPCELIYTVLSQPDTPIDLPAANDVNPLFRQCSD